MAYTYYSQLVIDKTKVGETDINFAVLINGTYDGTGGEPDLRTVGNGGHIQNTAAGGASGAYTVPADFAFSPNTDGSSPYDFEIEKYDAVTGEIVAWVQCGVDTIADTVFYIVYGDAGVVVSQENVAGTWDGGFGGVWHLGEASGTIYDSTGNNYNSASVDVAAYQAAGQVGYGIEFDGIGNVIGLSGAPSPRNTVSVEAWVKTTGHAEGTLDWIIDRTGTNVGFGLCQTINDKAAIALFGTVNRLSSSVSINDDAWHYLIGTYNRFSVGARIYVDGVLRGSNSWNVSISYNSTENKAIGGKGAAGNFDGIIDEVRISIITRSANHVTTCYNNQSDPGTFYSVGSEEGKALAGDAVLQRPFSPVFRGVFG